MVRQGLPTLSIALLALLFGLVLATPAFAGVTERSVYYSYDAMGRQLSAKFDSATGADGVTNQYNGFGELTSTTLTMGAFNKTVTSTYDCAGRRTQVTHPDNQAFAYTYDALGRLSGVYEGAATAACPATSAGNPLDSFTYTNAGLPNNRAEGSTGASNVTYGWDDVGRLTSQSDAFSNTANNVGRTFGMNPASQITSETRSNSAYAYTGLVAVNRTYQVNGLNQYTSAGPANFAYDDNGNLISDGTNSYTYDVENRLVTATRAGATVYLTYDPLGRLWQLGGSTIADVQFLYDGDALVAEYSASSGAMTNRYVHGSNAAADDPLVWYAGADLSSRRFLHSDHLGSIVAVTNCSAGNECINKYDEYGVPQTDAATHTSNLNVGRFQYTGQAWLGEIGMYYYKARIYSPTLGRFLQTDPIGYKDQINLYEYAGNDPVDAIDPTGTDMAVMVGGWAPKSLNVFGHVAIAFTGRGVYSFGTKEAFGSSTTAYLQSQATYRSTHIIIIPTTADQDLKAISYLRQHYDHTTYHWYSQNCASAVIEAMEAAGLKHPNALALQSQAAQTGGYIDTPSEAQGIAEMQPNTKALDQSMNGQVPSSMKSFDPPGQSKQDNRTAEWSIDNGRITGNRALGTRICPRGEAGPC